MTVFRHAEHVAFRSLGPEEGGVLLHLTTGQYHSVNEVGALLWDLLDGRTARDVADAARSRVDDPPDDFTAVVHDYLRQLTERGLVVVDA